MEPTTDVRGDGRASGPLPFLALMQSALGDNPEHFFDIYVLLCGYFKVVCVTPGLTPGHCAFLGDQPLILLYIDLVTQHNEGKGLRVPAGGDEEIVPPTVQGLE